MPLPVPPLFTAQPERCVLVEAGGHSATRGRETPRAEKPAPRGKGAPHETEHTHGACGGLYQPRGPPGQNPSAPRMHTETSRPFHGPPLCPSMDVPPHAQAWMNYPLHTGERGEA